MFEFPIISHAAYASDWQVSRGRLVAEARSATRGEFQRDRDRIIHSTAFRRLAHKTQVFVPLEGDHFRTRLTHTIEVAQIARALARALRLDEDLAEALALAHDLGHTPFGHTGEDVLEACLGDHGGFDHNAQALRIVTKLEHRYARFEGLNLTWETLEGLVKHNGPLRDAKGEPLPRYHLRGIPAAIVEYDARHPLELASFASAEAQAAAIADDIAYNAHDLDDGLRAGMFSLQDLSTVGFLAGLLDEIAQAHPGLERQRIIHELGRRVITNMVEDVIAQSQLRLAAIKPTDVAQIRASSAPTVGFSPAMVAVDKAIKAFLHTHLYRHPKVMHIRTQAAEVVRNLFEHYQTQPTALPADWAQAALLRTDGDATRRARLIADYIAGMTDRFALSEHMRLLGSAPDLRSFC